MSAGVTTELHAQKREALFVCFTFLSVIKIQKGIFFLVCRFLSITKNQNGLSFLSKLSSFYSSLKKRLDFSVSPLFFLEGQTT